MRADRNIFCSIKNALRFSYAASCPNPRGFERIYHYHIRKTAGTSLNCAFLGVAVDADQVSAIYERLSAKKKRDCNGYVIAGWDRKVLEKGRYFYGFSHIPQHAIRLPRRTFTVTCVRKPISRVLSHYKMLVEYHEQGIDHPCMKTEWPWARDGLHAFVQRIPDEHLCRQLYMFSRSYSVDEAFENITGCNHVIFTEDFGAGVASLAEKLGGLRLHVRHEKRSRVPIELPPRTEELLRGRMGKEIELYERLRSHFGVSGS